MTKPVSRPAKRPRRPGTPAAAPAQRQSGKAAKTGKTPRHFAIIGAGMAGVVCARTLVQAGHQVTVFEKSSKAGGRTTTIDSPFGSFDAGAQYFTVRDPRFAQATVARLHAPRLRLYANDDLTGVEVGAAVKNVMAIATGVSDGLGYGNNARAALITRGLAEVSRLAEAFGARPSTLMGLAGLGDLVLTCTGELSRNRTVGLLLAQGKHLDTILAELGHVAEGVPTTREVAALAERHGVDMPITRAVHAMLFEHASPDAVVTSLLAREPKTE